ncbi:MAG: biotin--[acetyl-CoA-carboxylase] ligase [Bacteroidales bacterium]|nr:biotin--[acetyl-CoA-carboxylase] ligase [Bacteroidales bacterium]
MHEEAQIIWYEKLKSTNDEARRRLAELANLSVISTKSQSAGRGQGDHTWYSSPDTNLTFTFVLHYADFAAPLPVSDALLITCLTTLGIREYLLAEGIEARIKWPNDIWVGEKKICGILIENILDADRVAHSIVGVGLNVNEQGWPEELPNPVSMLELTGVRRDLPAALERLHAQICRHAAMLDTPEGRAYLLDTFNRYMFRLPAGN